MNTLTNICYFVLLQLIGIHIKFIYAGSCREAQLCCNGRDSSCVVQKAPINAIIEDLSDKPCYCDHACLKLGDCCPDFKDHCGVLDCQVSEWGPWSECDTNCGTGMMSRTRTIEQSPQNGGKHCPSLVQKRGCQGYRCHGHKDKKVLREMALLLPAALSRNRHANDSNDIRQNLRLRYRDSFKHNRDHEYCVEFEVIKASKACHKLPPYNLMLEGDRITVRCDLEALIHDSSSSNTSNFDTDDEYNNFNDNTNDNNNNYNNYNNNNNNNNDGSDTNNSHQNEITNNSSNLDEEDTIIKMHVTSASTPSPSSSSRKHRSSSSSLSSSSSSSSTSSSTTKYRCRGEGLAGRTTRWSALAAPSCRGKWLRLTVGQPKKCNQSQFIFV